MGTHAERVAIKEQVSREDQDAFALRSLARQKGKAERHAKLLPGVVRVTFWSALAMAVTYGIDDTRVADERLEHASDYRFCLNCAARPRFNGRSLAAIPSAQSRA